MNSSVASPSELPDDLPPHPNHGVEAEVASGGDDSGAHVENVAASMASDAPAPSALEAGPPASTGGIELPAEPAGEVGSPDASGQPQPHPLVLGDRVEGKAALTPGDPVSGAPAQARLILADGRTVNIDPSELDSKDLAPVPGIQAADPSTPESAPTATTEEPSPEISAFVVRVDPSGEVWVSRANGSAALLFLINARDHGETVEGKVVAQGPGGLEVDLGGGIFAVCPSAEIGDEVDNPGHLVGQRLAFKVKEASSSQVLLSRKAVLQDSRANSAEEESRAEAAAEVRRRLRPGAVMPGRISRVREFGAFVDLGAGVEGLIHLSELSHQRVSSPKDVVEAGQPVEVQVLKVDYDAHKGERISLSLKALAKSAWEKTLETVKVGQQLSGKVTRVEAFGAFIELAAGVTGLIHVSALGGKRGGPANELVKAGDEVRVEVLSLDPEKRRIALKRLPSEAEVVERRAAQQEVREHKKQEARQKREESRQKPHERLKPGEVVDAVVDRIEPYGFFLQLKGGGRGMVHVSEMGPLPEGEAKTLPEAFPKGAKLRVAVLEIDAEHRIRLSRSAVPEIEKGASAEAYLKHKAQHELEEKLLRSASRPTLSARPPPRRSAAPRLSNTQPLENQTAPSGPQLADRFPRRAFTRAAPTATSARPPRERNEARGQERERPRRPEVAPSKSSGLGTLGDLLKVKLQQRKG